jgi:DNA invertase Pin-like site-specific DNA recombinase
MNEWVGPMSGIPPGRPVGRALTPNEAAEVRRLWADYYEASARAVEIMRSEGTTEAALPRVAAEAAKADAALTRLKEIHGIR